MENRSLRAWGVFEREMPFNLQHEEHQDHLRSNEAAAAGFVLLHDYGDAVGRATGVGWGFGRRGRLTDGFCLIMN